ncbi:MAG: 23S rRNA (uracil(1939)-C(5))-methyltransferase RlmD, partial [Bacillota bacterium]|nr:23S rRNA (uracil(1939)-C(5))-methyltransferase RlmD [Bacillota bacterium]
MSCSKEKVQLEISGWAGDGCGAARLPDGKAVFVSRAMPGEKVLATVTKEKKSCAWARLEELIQPAAGRVSPACPHYAGCGGCVLQHMDYQTQLEYKRDQVAQALRGIGKLDVEVLPVLPAESPWGYRNRVVFHVQQEPELRFGLYQEKSRRLSPPDCPLLRQPLRELAEKLARFLPLHASCLKGLRELALRCDHSGDKLLLSFVADHPLKALEALAAELAEEEPRLVSIWENSGSPVYSVYGEDWRHLWGEEYLLDQLAGVELELSPAAFLQVNHGQAERLYAQVRRFLGELRGKRLLDVYCGVGSIGLAFCGELGQLIGVESYAPSVAAAKRNAERNGFEDCRFFCGPAEQVLPELLKQGLRVDKLVLDPPRAGCERAALAAIADMVPESLVYVSCDPATLARDLAILVEGGYEVQAVQPVDLFPQTSHVETVCLLSKLNAKQHIEINLDMDELDLTDA